MNVRNADIIRCTVSVRGNRRLSIRISTNFGKERSGLWKDSLHACLHEFIYILIPLLKLHRNTAKEWIRLLKHIIGKKSLINYRSSSNSPHGLVEPTPLTAEDFDAMKNIPIERREHRREEGNSVSKFKHPREEWTLFAKSSSLEVYSAAEDWWNFLSDSNYYFRLIAYVFLLLTSFLRSKWTLSPETILMQL